MIDIIVILVSIVETTIWWRAWSGLITLIYHIQTVLTGCISAPNGHGVYKVLRLCVIPFADATLAAFFYISSIIRWIVE